MIKDTFETEELLRVCILQWLSTEICKNVFTLAYLFYLFGCAWT